MVEDGDKETVEQIKEKNKKTSFTIPCAPSIFKSGTPNRQVRHVTI
jgi:hypothetical protein